MFSSFPIVSERTRNDSFGNFRSFKKIRESTLPADGLATFLEKSEYPVHDGIFMGTSQDVAFIYRMKLTFEMTPMFKTARFVGQGGD